MKLPFKKTFELNQVDKMHHIGRTRHISPASRRLRLVTLVIKLVFSGIMPFRVAEALKIHIFLLKRLPPPIYVLTPRKTGTWSTYTPLVERHGGLVHRRSGRWGWRRTGDNPPKLNLPVTWLTDVYNSDLDPAGPHLDYAKLWPGAEIRVINLVREPIARAISDFFQRAYQGLNPAVPKSDLLRMSAPELQRHFLDAYGADDEIEGWYDHNIRDLFGIDVYGSPWNAAGHREYSSGRVRLLVMRVTLSDGERNRLIAEFCDLRPFEYSAVANAGQQKEYAAAYKKFLANLKLPAEYVERMCGSRYATHFFSEAERAEMRTKWLKT